MRWRSFYGCPTIVQRVSSLLQFLFYYKFYREKNKKYKPLISLTVTVNSPVKGLMIILKGEPVITIFTYYYLLSYICSKAKFSQVTLSNFTDTYTMCNFKI